MSTVLFVLLWALAGLLHLAIYRKINWTLWRKLHPGIGPTIFLLTTHAVLGPILWVFHFPVVIYRAVTGNKYDAQS